MIPAHPFHEQKIQQHEQVLVGGENVVDSWLRENYTGVACQPPIPPNLTPTMLARLAQRYEKNGWTVAMDEQGTTWTFSVQDTPRPQALEDKVPLPRLIERRETEVAEAINGDPHAAT